LALSPNRKRRSALYRVLFNIAAPSLSIWVAANLFFWLADKPPLLSFEGVVRIVDVAVPLVVFTLVYFLLNSWLIALAISLAEGVSAFGVWKNNLLWLLLNYLGGASVAALLVGYRGTFGVGLLLVIAPILLVLHFTMRTVLGRVEDANQHLEGMNTLYLSTIETLATAIDAKDQITHGHIRRVQYFATALAQEIGITEDAQIKAIEAAALLHDMGKLAVPDHILNKPGPLTPAEFHNMQQHAAIGAEILSSINFPYPVVPIVRHHHEHWDGSGYPDGLKGTEIPIGARILSVVDCFDALTSDRPYRLRLADGEALRILSERRGNMYDPLVVDTFISNYSKLATAALKLDYGTDAPGLTAISQSRTLQPLSVIHSQTPATTTSAVDGSIASLAANAIDTSDECTVVVFGLSDAGDGLVARTVVGVGDEIFTGTTARMTERVVGWVAANGTSIHNADARLDGPLMRWPGTCTAIPLRHSGSVAGVLAVYTYRDRVLTEQETTRLESLARGAACKSET
jgi:putative nucleotidyltransferase with HDIG domain